MKMIGAVFFVDLDPLAANKSEVDIFRHFLDFEDLGDDKDAGFQNAVDVEVLSAMTVFMPMALFVIPGEMNLCLFACQESCWWLILCMLVCGDKMSGAGC
jgi:hypothetical protein